ARRHSWTAATTIWTRATAMPEPFPQGFCLCWPCLCFIARLATKQSGVTTKRESGVTTSSGNTTGSYSPPSRSPRKGVSDRLCTEGANRGAGAMSDLTQWPDVPAKLLHGPGPLPPSSGLGAMPDSGMRVAKLLAIKSDIAQHLDRPDLSIAGLAA